MDVIGKSRLVVDMPATKKKKFKDKCESQDVEMTEKTVEMIDDYLNDKKTTKDGKCLVIRRKPRLKN